MGLEAEKQLCAHSSRQRHNMLSKGRKCLRGADWVTGKEGGEYESLLLTLVGSLIARILAGDTLCN